MCCVSILAWRVTSSKEVADLPTANVGDNLQFDFSREWLKFVGPQRAFIEKRRCKLP